MGRLSFLRSTPGAARSLRIDPFPGVIAERDTSIGLAVGGPDAMTAAGWRARWHVVAGRDDPPAGRWGWVIVEAGIGPATTIRRVPPTFKTRMEALTAGEDEAAALWAGSPARLASPGRGEREGANGHATSSGSARRDVGLRPSAQPRVVVETRHGLSRRRPTAQPVPSAGRAGPVSR